MGIYERDYRKLKTEEELEFFEIKKQEEIGTTGTITIRKNLYDLYPKAAKHYMTLFPNNYLDPYDFYEKDKKRSVIEGFKKIISSGLANERSVASYIKINEGYFIIGSILKRNYNFGHHGAFIFPEFPLGSSHKVDYLLIGLNSDGYSFVFVEIESPAEKITISGGDFGESIRKGMNQVQDWNSWLERNFSSLRDEFSKHIKPGDTLPEEFNFYEKGRINYAVVSGMRKDFLKKTRINRRKIFKENSILVLHYENIIDSSEQLVEGGLTY